MLDTTGSMGPLIEGAKRKIWSIATAIVDANPDAEIRMGLVAYRDIGDDYVTKIFDLTTDIQDLYANLLELRARGGGDWPESVNEALHVGVTKLSWTQGAEICRIMFLVGDAPPHMDYAQDTKYPEVLRIARERDITVNAVQAGAARDTERVWREIAQRGHGRYIPIPQDGGKIVMIETPFDLEIIELQGRINGTVIPYGPRAQRSQGRGEDPPGRGRAALGRLRHGGLSQQARGAAAAKPSPARGDLVADVAAGRQKLSAVKDEDLPDASARAEADRARRRWSTSRAPRARRSTNAWPSWSRSATSYVAEQRKNAPAKTADSFDRAVEETLQAQIKR